MLAELPFSHRKSDGRDPPAAGYFSSYLQTLATYSHSTRPNQFCLEIIICRVCSAFDYLIYPYYPAYMG